MTNETQQLDYERIRILYNSMNRIFIGGALLVLFLGFIIREKMAIHLVIIWVSLTLAFYIPRLVTTWMFNKKIKSGQLNSSNVLIWEVYWILTTVPVLVSFSSLLYYPLADSQINIIATFLVIMASGSILSYASSLKSIAASFCAIYIPLIIRYTLIEDEDAATFVTFYILLVAVFSSYALSLHRTLIENIQLKIDNEHNALKDPLTQLWNRRGLYLHLNKIIPRSIRKHETLGIILIDVDNFKEYNDTYGHNAGDDVLINVATCIEQEGRSSDLVVRYGGEEFLAVIPDTNTEHLKEITERIFQSVRSNTNITISAGLALQTPGNNFGQIINQADTALYEAKRAGRDQYQIAKQSETT